MNKAEEYLKFQELLKILDKTDTVTLKAIKVFIDEKLKEND